MTTEFQTREEYLHTAAELLIEYHLDATGFAPDLDGFKVSCGFARGRQRKELAVFKREQSEAGVNEIFISPYVNDTDEALTLLARGLAEASRDCSHSGGQVRREMATKGLQVTLDRIRQAVGDYPHEKIKKPPVGGTRQLKCQCRECGAVWRLSQKWLDAVMACPCCISSKLILDGEEVDTTTR